MIKLIFELYPYLFTLETHLTMMRINISKYFICNCLDNPQIYRLRKNDECWQGTYFVFWNDEPNDPTVYIHLCNQLTSTEPWVIMISNGLNKIRISNKEGRASSVMYGWEYCKKSLSLSATLRKFKSRWGWWLSQVAAKKKKSFPVETPKRCVKPYTFPFLYTDLYC